MNKRLKSFFFVVLVLSLLYVVSGIASGTLFALLAILNRGPSDDEVIEHFRKNELDFYRIQTLARNSGFTDRYRIERGGKIGLSLYFYRDPVALFNDVSNEIKIEPSPIGEDVWIASMEFQRMDTIWAKVLNKVGFHSSCFDSILVILDRIRCDQIDNNNENVCLRYEKSGTCGFTYYLYADSVNLPQRSTEEVRTFINARVYVEKDCGIFN